MKKKGSNQHKTRWQYGGLDLEAWYSILVCLGFMFFVLWFLEITEPKIISPLSDNPVIPTVHASDDRRGTSEEPESIIRRVAGRHAPGLIRIARCESGLWPRAVSRTGDYGLFQISLRWHGKRIPGQTNGDKIVWLQDMENNTWIAYSLYLEQGTRPWKSSEHCWGK